MVPPDIKTKRIDNVGKVGLTGLFVSVVTRMQSYVFMVVQKLNLDMGDSKKNDEFSKSSRELVTILFAVVLGLGLEQLNHIDQAHFVSDLLLLIIGYIAVVLSWWFYHKGTIAGPKENNVLLYTVDCFLMIVYWLLINLRGSMQRLLFIYAAMFFLYWIWELIRICQQPPEPNTKKVKKACRVNLNYFLLSLLIALFFYVRIWPLGRSITFDSAVCLTAIYCLVLYYRRPISKIYQKDIRTQPQSV
ncbi:MAG: hypothetical protein CEE38_01490 [Planctomycetes bacterium B3_Pla]|nr:MAG: hypothetical protein CEE38_01490 [Planctomycetes bacterium B3_Pla]